MFYRFWKRHDTCGSMSFQKHNNRKHKFFVFVHAQYVKTFGIFSAKLFTRLFVSIHNMLKWDHVTWCKVFLLQIKSLKLTNCFFPLRGSVTKRRYNIDILSPYKVIANILSSSCLYYYSFLLHIQQIESKQVFSQYPVYTLVLDR